MIFYNKFSFFWNFDFWNYVRVFENLMVVITVYTCAEILLIKNKIMIKN